MIFFFFVILFVLLPASKRTSSTSLSPECHSEFFEAGMALCQAAARGLRASRFWARPQGSDVF